MEGDEVSRVTTMLPDAGAGPSDATQVGSNHRPTIASRLSTISLGGFAVAAGGLFVGIIAAAWIWAAVGRMWFLDPEYAMWMAKSEMIRGCEHGEITILGDLACHGGSHTQ